MGETVIHFVMANPTTARLSELNLYGEARWEPGVIWNLGFPFGVDGAPLPELGGDARFSYRELPSGEVVNGRIVIVPEPATIVIAMLAVLLIVVYRRAIEVRI